MTIHPFQIRQAAHVARAGGVIAYPTEAVYGLGCDPLNGEAVHRILDLKGRIAAKGLILVAADLAQVEPYLIPLPKDLKAKVEASWPGPVTWLLPARPEVPDWLRGEHDTLAVRVSAHPVVAGLCRMFDGPLVSTSANRSGHHPARSPLAVRRIFGDDLDYILHGPLGGLDRPTEIRDGATGRLVRS
jgi:L-threonylcarbamoyladenylate synthase